MTYDPVPGPRYVLACILLLLANAAIILSILWTPTP